MVRTKANMFIFKRNSDKIFNVCPCRNAMCKTPKRAYMIHPTLMIFFLVNNNINDLFGHIKKIEEKNR